MWLAIGYSITVTNGYNNRHIIEGMFTREHVNLSAFVQNHNYMGT